MTVFHQSFYVFGIITFKGTGCIILHRRLKLAEKLFIIDDISKVLGIIVQTVYSTDRLEQTVILHILINIQICARWSIESRKQLIYNNKQFHICRLFHKFPFRFLLKLLDFCLNRSGIWNVRGINAKHFEICFILQKCLSIIFITDGICAQFTLIWSIG